MKKTGKRQKFRKMNEKVNMQFQWKSLIQRMLNITGTTFSVAPLLLIKTIYCC